MNSKDNSNHLRIKIDDTTLDCHDSGGDGQAIIFLNGAYGSQGDWTKVIRKLDKEYRVITYDERARGKSATSSDYSFAACVRDLAAIVKATGVKRPLLVGWSYGAAIAVAYSAKNADNVAGLLLIDGAYPIDIMSTTDKQQVRQTFRKMALVLPLLAFFGKAARMSADQAADVNIELQEILGKMGETYAKLTLPIYFICPSKKSMGGTEEQFRTMRSTAYALAEKYKHIKVFKTLPCSHLEILSKYPDSVVAAITELTQHQR